MSTKTIDCPVDSTAVVLQLIQPFYQPQLEQPASASSFLLSKQPQLTQPKTIHQSMLIQLAFSTRK